MFAFLLAALIYVPGIAGPIGPGSPGSGGLFTGPGGPPPPPPIAGSLFLVSGVDPVFLVSGAANVCTAGGGC